MQRFEDKVALITGAASGIGRATALRMAEEGASLICADLQAEAAQETAKLAEERGGRAIACTCDVSQPDDVNATIAQAMEQYGKLDALCNIAGFLRMDNFHEMALDDWNRVLLVNLTGTMLMCQAALPHLLDGGGSIVNASSTSALAGLPWGTAYAASKGGVLALTRALAIEYGRQGIRANAVCPGSIKTPMTGGLAMPEGVDLTLIHRAMPLDIPRGPETVAGVIAMLASEDGAHINGEYIRVDGGTLS
jgi:meso-butanediol dehydrogenase/(S,S)-butanediol dehydrogenase/diacetyl reductase